MGDADGLHLCAKILRRGRAACRRKGSRLPYQLALFLSVIRDLSGLTIWRLVSGGVSVGCYESSGAQLFPLDVRIQVTRWSLSGTFRGRKKAILQT